MRILGARRVGSIAISVVAAVCLTVAGCGDTSPTSGSMRLEPDPAAPRDTKFLAWNVPVTIAGETRTALAASQPVILKHEVLDGASPRQKVLSGIVAAEFKELLLSIIGPANVTNGVPEAIRVYPLSNMQLGAPFHFPVDLDRVNPGAEPYVAIWPVVPLEKRDIDTVALEVPAHSVLRIGIGAEPACWDVMAQPLQMIVSAVDATGQVETLQTTALNLYKRDFRRWVDVEVPLDAIAGRTVRFRFASRMAGPPLIRYALPVFSSPTINLATAAGTY